jgi:RHS repeat-associated protein
VPDAGKLRVDFTYDWKGRRIQKVVSIWNGTAYVPQSTTKYVYDGWNLVAILNSDSSLQSSFAWGTDLSGSPQGAGGVGGLLWMTVNSGANAGTYFYAFDGNGNVVALVNAATGAVASQYEYGPFGELLRATGPSAKANSFRFSTKFQDDETDLLYYGYRYYSASMGRWLSHEPLSTEDNGALYNFVRNGVEGAIDKLGQSMLIILVQDLYNQKAPLDKWNDAGVTEPSWKPDYRPEPGPDKQCQNNLWTSDPQSWAAVIRERFLGSPEEAQTTLVGRGKFRTTLQTHEDVHAILALIYTAMAWDIVSMPSGKCVCKPCLDAWRNFEGGGVNLAFYYYKYYTYEFDIEAYGGHPGDRTAVNEAKFNIHQIGPGVRQAYNNMLSVCGGQLDGPPPISVFNRFQTIIDNIPPP